MLFNFLAQTIDTKSLPHVSADQGALDTVLSIVFQITASIAVLMVVIGGMRYILARGEPAGVTQAKNTILYAIIGLIVSLTAYSIVRLVLGNVA